MLSDDRLAQMVLETQAVEREVRHLLQTTDMSEHAAVLLVVRHATALRRSIEGWIVSRATRAHVVQSK